MKNSTNTVKNTVISKLIGNGCLCSLGTGIKTWEISQKLLIITHTLDSIVTPLTLLTNITVSLHAVVGVFIRIGCCRQHLTCCLQTPADKRSYLLVFRSEEAPALHESGPSRAAEGHRGAAAAQRRQRHQNRPAGAEDHTHHRV